MSKFHQWQKDGNLSLDIEVLEPDGTINVRRVHISRDRLASILADDQDGIRFFMNKVMSKIRPLMKFNTASLSKAIKMPEVSKNLMKGFMPDDILPPQFVELEKSLYPSHKVETYIFPVVV